MNINEALGKHFIPSHFFEHGCWRVRAECHSRNPIGFCLRCNRLASTPPKLITIASDLSRKTAKVIANGWRLAGAFAEDTTDMPPSMTRND